MIENPTFSWKLRQTNICKDGYEPGQSQTPFGLCSIRIENGPIWVHLVLFESIIQICDSI